MLFKFVNLPAQNKFNLLQDEELVVETSRITLVQILDYKKINQLQEFSGIKPISGVIIWKDVLSQIVSQTLNTTDTNSVRIMVEWCLTYCDSIHELTIKRIKIFGIKVNDVALNILERKLLTIPFAYYPKGKLDDKMNFMTIFRKKSGNVSN